MCGPQEIQERIFLSAEDAIEKLVDGDIVHCFTEHMIGADWKREDVIKYIDDADATELSGPAATATGHGICTWGKNGPRFFQTK